jgi:predicted DNA-binding transcriptional regulator AlpA
MDTVQRQKCTKTDPNGLPIDGYMTPLQVAKRFQMGRTWIYRRVAEGAFPNAKKFGNARGQPIRIPISDVEAYELQHQLV